MRHCRDLWNCVVLVISLPLARGLTEYEALVTVKRFADHFLSPANIAEGRTINSTLFAEDVKGTVDLSANFDSRELSTEYVFGLFVQNDLDQTDPSPFGVPLAYNISHIVVQHGYIASSTIFDFFYRSLNRSFPIQIDAFILVNEAQQIQQYDMVFRRWSWATDTIIPQLIPHMAEHINLASTNDTYILQQYLVQKVCKASSTYCHGDDQQYESYEACTAFLTARPLGQWYRMGEDNLVCRHLHVPMISLRPSVHCPHIGPTGGDMCIDRDYTKVATMDHFPFGWMAPKIITPENAAEVSQIKAPDGGPLDPLLEIAMSSGSMHSWDPSIYPISLFGYFFGYYFCAHLLQYVYIRRSNIFRTLSLEHRRNVVMYTMNVIVTTIALGLQLAATPAFGGMYRLWGIECLRACGAIVSSLYMFELVYRIRARLSLVVHHFLTIFAISWTVAVFEYTSSMTYMVSAIIWIFQATTEQPTFLGLLGYRMGWPRERVSWLLKIASLQTFVVKVASAIGLMVYWGFKQNYTYRPIDIAWSVLLFISSLGLMATQIWGSYMTYAIAIRLDRQTFSLRRDGLSQVGLATHSAGSNLSRSSSFKGQSDSAATSSFIMHELAHKDPVSSLVLEEPYAGHRHAQAPSPVSSTSDMTPRRVPPPASPDLRTDRGHQEQSQAEQGGFFGGFAM